MKVTLEGSNSAEAPSLWDGGTRSHRPVTGKLAVRLHNRNISLFVFFCLCSFLSPLSFFALFSFASYWPLIVYLFEFQLPNLVACLLIGYVLDFFQRSIRTSYLRGKRHCRRPRLMSFCAEIGGGCRSGEVFITTYFGAWVGRKDGRQYPSLELYNYIISDDARCYSPRTRHHNADHPSTKRISAYRQESSQHTLNDQNRP